MTIFQVHSSEVRDSTNLTRSRQIDDAGGSSNWRVRRTYIRNGAAVSFTNNTTEKRRRPAWRCVILRRSINGFLDKHLQMHEKAFGSWFTTFSWKRFFFKVRSIRSMYPCFLLNLNFHAKDNIYTSCTTFTNFSNIWIFVPNMLIFLSAEIFAFCDLWPQLKTVERSFLHSLIF